MRTIIERLGWRSPVVAFLFWLVLLSYAWNHGLIFPALGVFAIGVFVVGGVILAARVKEE